MSQPNQSEFTSPVSIPEAVSRAYNADIKLNVSREDIAFVAGIQTFLEIERNHALLYADLEKIYEIVNEIVLGNRETVSQRSLSAVERLLKNQLLIRIDGGGISHSAKYDMTRLGRSIVEFLMDNETLTQQNLTIITKRIIGLLAEIRRELTSSGSDRFWEEGVLLPLQHVISELLGAIEKRQKGLDKSQEEVRVQIRTLLEKEWLDALEICENLLQTTSDALQELYRTLLAENTAIKQGLNEIYEQADNALQQEVLNTIDGIYHRLDQLELWGNDRVTSWSQYYRRVNDFLQSIVRFDPNREYSQKLKEQIHTYPNSPWFLKVLDPPVYITTRDIQITQKKHRAVRKLDHLNTEDAINDDDGNLILDLMIDQVKEQLKTDQPMDLIEVIKPFLTTYPLDKIYPHIGTLTDLMVKETSNRPNLPKEWVVPVEQIELELQNLVVSRNLDGKEKNGSGN